MSGSTPTVETATATAAGTAQKSGKRRRPSHVVRPTYEKTNAGHATANPAEASQTNRLKNSVSPSAGADSCPAYASAQTPVVPATPTKLHRSAWPPRERFPTAYTENAKDATAATSSGTVYGVGCHVIDTGRMREAGKNGPNPLTRSRSVDPYARTRRRRARHHAHRPPRRDGHRRPGGGQSHGRVLLSPRRHARLHRRGVWLPRRVGRVRGRRRRRRRGQRRPRRGPRTVRRGVRPPLRAPLGPRRRGRERVRLLRREVDVREHLRRRVPEHVRPRRRGHRRPRVRGRLSRGPRRRDTRRRRRARRLSGAVDAAAAGLDRPEIGDRARSRSHVSERPQGRHPAVLYALVNQVKRCPPNERSRSASPRSRRPGWESVTRSTP